MTVSHYTPSEPLEGWARPVFSKGKISIGPDEGLQVLDGRTLTWHPMGTLGWDLGAPGFTAYLIGGCT